MPSPAVREHFDRLSSSGGWSDLYRRADGFTYQFHVRRQRVLDLLPPRCGRVLDVGCGPGVMVKPILERGGTFEGVDLSPQMVEEARGRYVGWPGVSFRQGDLETLDLPAQAYDQILCMAVIEYLKDPERAFGQLARLLRPGGEAIVTIPKRWHFDRIMVAVSGPLRAAGRRLGLGRSDELPRLRLQPSELDRIARRAGLIPAGGAHYFFKILPYPFPRFAPGLAMRVNLPLERWHAARDLIRTFFAHGYVGRYRKAS